MSRWDSDAFNDPGTARQVLKDIKSGWLGYMFHPLFDWRARPNVTLKTISTNEFGLRCGPAAAWKTNKCLLVGGSFPWGYGASSNENIPSSLLQKDLEQQGVEMSVVNLADQMYASSQQIKSFVFSVDDLKPSHVICVTGYNDTSQGFRGVYRNHPRYSETSAFINWGRTAGVTANISNLKKIAKIIYHLNAGHEDPYKDQVALAKPPRDDIPLTMCSHTINVIKSYCVANSIKVAFVLEPLVYFKNSLTDWEKSILDHVGEEKMNFFTRAFSEMKKSLWDSGPMTPFS